MKINCNYFVFQSINFIRITLTFFFSTQFRTDTSGGIIVRIISPAGITWNIGAYIYTYIITTCLPNYKVLTEN